MEETVSSRLETEMEQKTLHHCSANTMTAGDLGPGLPRSVRGGTGVREGNDRVPGPQITSGRSTRPLLPPPPLPPPCTQPRPSPSPALPLVMCARAAASSRN
eukprot:superscaffoldBa00004489_g18963